MTSSLGFGGRGGKVDRMCAPGELVRVARWSVGHDYGSGRGVALRRGSEVIVEIASRVVVVKYLGDGSQAKCLAVVVLCRRSMRPSGRYLECEGWQSE